MTTVPESEESTQGKVWLTLGTLTSVLLTLLIPVAAFILAPLDAAVVTYVFDTWSTALLVYIFVQAMAVLKRPVTGESYVFTDYWTSFLPLVSVFATILVAITIVAVDGDTFNPVRWVSYFSGKVWLLLLTTAFATVIDLILLRLGYKLALYASELFKVN